jgi:hypothetical protein
MRCTLAFVTLFAAACAPPSTVVVPEAPPQTQVAAETPPPKPKTDAKRLHGTWGWNDDVEVFHPDGRGTYWRRGEVCYEFVYVVEGDVVTKTADRDHQCGAKREASYQFRVEKGELIMKHVGSGFESQWKPARSPKGPPSASPSGGAGSDHGS